MPVPTTQDLVHYRGDTFLAYVRLWQDTAHTVPSNLPPEAIVAAQLRLASTSPDVVTEFDVSFAGNVITLALPHSKAVTLPASSVYDVQVDWLGDLSNVQTVLAGKFSANADVTRTASDPNSTKAKARSNGS